jgi:hypothetical protein
MVKVTRLVSVTYKGDVKKPNDVTVKRYGLPDPNLLTSFLRVSSKLLQTSNNPMGIKSKF